MLNYYKYFFTMKHNSLYYFLIDLHSDLNNCPLTLQEFKIQIQITDLRLYKNNT